MMKRLILCLGVLALLIPAATGLAQPGIDNIEGLIDGAVQALGQQLGVAISRADLTRWHWEEVYFTDTALNCPLPDESYTPSYTRGYIILLDYQRVRYEFHLTPDGLAVHFCGRETLSLPSPTPAPTTEATPTPTGPNAAGLPADPQATFDLALAYINAQTHLGLTRSHLTTWSWRVALWDDEALDCPQPNRNYAAFARPVPGFSFSLITGRTEYEVHMTWDGSRIMPCGDDGLLPYVDRDRDPLAALPPAQTPTPTPAVAG